jgi:hypothetical protein
MASSTDETWAILWSVVKGVVVVLVIAEVFSVDENG